MPPAMSAAILVLLLKIIAPVPLISGTGKGHALVCAAKLVVLTGRRKA